MKKFTALFLLIIAIASTVFLFPKSADAVSKTLTAVSSVCILSIDPDQNTADWNSFSVGRNTHHNAETRGLVKFDLGPIPPLSSIHSAYLKAYQYLDASTQSDTKIEVVRAIDNWEEETVTWSNRPRYMIKPNSTTSIERNYQGYVEWEVTNIVKGWFSGKYQNYGFYILAPHVFETWFSFFYANDHAAPPQLVVEYTAFRDYDMDFSEIQDLPKITPFTLPSSDVDPDSSNPTPEPTAVEEPADEEPADEEPADEEPVAKEEPADEEPALPEAAADPADSKDDKQIAALEEESHLNESKKDQTEPKMEKLDDLFKPQEKSASPETISVAGVMIDPDSSLGQVLVSAQNNNHRLKMIFYAAMVLTGLVFALLALKEKKTKYPDLKLSEAIGIEFKKFKSKVGRLLGLSPKKTEPEDKQSNLS